MLPEPPRHVDGPPPILWGCTQPELFRLGLRALLTSAPYIIVLTALFSPSLMLSPPIALAALVLTTALGLVIRAKLLQRRKRFVPEGYLEQQARMRRGLSRWGHSPIIHRAGPWSIGRTQR